MEKAAPQDWEQTGKQEAEVGTECGLRLRLFGPFGVWLAGKPLPTLRTRKGLWLLALLVLRAEREVARDWLAGVLWPDSPNEGALANLRRSLTDLRQALCSEAWRLEAPTAQTLRFALSGADADVARFDALANSDNLEKLRQAAELHVAPLLEDCAEEWAFQERNAREQTWFGMVEKLARAALEAGQGREAAHWAQKVVARDPLRESARRLQMEALAAVGDYAAMLQAYRALRQLLRSELAAEPDPETTALYEKLRAETKRKAALPTSGSEIAALVAAKPAPLAREEIASYETETSEAEASKPEPAVVAPPSNLRRSLTAMLGRETECAAVVAGLETSRLVTIVGSGGVGKTRLAVEAAHKLAAWYRDGAWIVELTALTEGERLAATVAAVLEIGEDAGKSAETILRESLRTKHLLLILDNCEHLVEACAAFAENLLTACPDVSLLATSRQALGVGGETLLPLAPLPVPDAKAIQLLPPEVLAGRYDCARLFVERAHAVDPTFALTPENAVIILQICARLDGIPLAIELAAARVRALDVAQIADRLQERFRLLTGGVRTAVAHQRTLQSLIDWSHELLTPEERVLFRRLAIFQGGWTLDAAEGVCREEERSGSELSPADVLDTLARLVDKSLVVVETTEVGRRYRLLETLREYAWARLEEAEEREAMQASHFAWFRDWVAEAAAHIMGAEQTLWFAHLDADHDNLRAALAACERTQDFLKMAGELQRFWLVRGYLREGREWLRQALARPDADNYPQQQSEALNGVGLLSGALSDAYQAREAHEAALAIRRRLGNRRGIAGSLNNLANALSALDERQEAIARVQEALAINREMQNWRWVAINLNNLGNFMDREEELDAAQSYFAQALAINRQLGNHNDAAGNLSNMASTWLQQGDLTRAQETAREALTMHRASGNRAWEAVTLDTLGQVAFLQRNWTEAESALLNCIQLAKEVGSSIQEIQAQAVLAEMRLQQGDRNGARELCRSVLRQPPLRDWNHALAMALGTLAGVALQQGRAEDAARCLGAIHEEQRNRMSYRVSPAGQMEAARRQAVRDVLGDMQAEEDFARGSVMYSEEIIALCEQWGV